MFSIIAGVHRCRSKAYLATPKYNATGGYILRIWKKKGNITKRKAEAMGNLLKKQTNNYNSYKKTTRTSRMKH